MRNMYLVFFILVPLVFEAQAERPGIEAITAPAVARFKNVLRTSELVFLVTEDSVPLGCSIFIIPP